jgi:hypothetical protein
MKLSATLLACVTLFLLSFAASASGKQVEAGNPEPKVEAAPEMVPRSWWLAERRKGKTMARYSVRLERSRNQLRRALLARPSVSEAINLAGATYGYTATLWSKARCESHLWPGAHNASGASGLFQFLPGTFASTPYARFSIWSPYANAMAAGWMHAHGRGGEWVCR